jgi:phosphatidylserine decarboxylase
LNIPIAKEAWPKVIILGSSAVLLLALSSMITIYPFIIMLFLMGFILFFFRDPKRVIPSQKNAVVSPGGQVVYTAYQPGKFTNAAKTKAPLINENNSVGIETNNMKIMIRQIAGLIAKRIVCKCKEGDALEKGERIGLIQFGSRVEIYLPSHVQLCVREGDKVKAKKNIIGIIAS